MLQQERAQDKEIKKIRIDLQISSNLRISIALKDSENNKFVVGSPMGASFITEHHVLTFERYITMPQELRMKRLKLAKNQEEPEEGIERVNPWLITDIDFTSQNWRRS